MAKTVNELGRGGQFFAERELGWNRGLIRKGQHELEYSVLTGAAVGMVGDRGFRGSSSLSGMTLLLV